MTQFVAVVVTAPAVIPSVIVRMAPVILRLDSATVPGDLLDQNVTFPAHQDFMVLTAGRHVRPVTQVSSISFSVCKMAYF